MSAEWSTSTATVSFASSTTVAIVEFALESIVVVGQLLCCQQSAVGSVSYSYPKDLCAGLG